MDNVFNNGSVVDISSQINELMEMASNSAKEILDKEFKRFFELVPEITIINWVQYTPYFNDGDVCDFSVGELNFFLDEEDKLSYEDAFNYNPFEIPSDYVYAQFAKNPSSQFYKEIIENYNNKNKEFGSDRVVEINKIIIQFSDFFRGFDNSIMLRVFGDHAEITATKNGFAVEMCEHE